MLRVCETFVDLSHSVGPIMVNASVWEGAASTKLQRMHKDAEVHTLSLGLMWSESKQLMGACADLVFEFKECGFGLHFQAEADGRG